MFTITNNNYNYYKQIFSTLWKFKANRLIKVDPNIEHSPINVLNNWEGKSKSIAKRGLKEGLRDILTMLFMDLSIDLKEELNILLISQEYPSFYQLISTIKIIPQKVLKSGKIKNLDEYYVIK